MISKLLDLLKIAVAFLPFFIILHMNSSANRKNKERGRQFFMPVVALLYCIVMLIFTDALTDLIMDLFYWLTSLFEKWHIPFLPQFMRTLTLKYFNLLAFMLFNTVGLLCFVLLKKLLLAIFCRKEIPAESFRAKIISIFYVYDEKDACWYIQPNMGQARTFIKTAYRSGVVLLAVLISVAYTLFSDGLLAEPFYPVLPLIMLGELYYFVDGVRKDEAESDLKMTADRSERVVMYSMLRKPLRTLFEDKLSSEGTTVNNGGANGGSVEDILIRLEQDGGHLGNNYAAFLRAKMKDGFRPNTDYLRSGYDLSTGKSLLFNTPFYDKLIPYVFYAMNRSLLRGGKVLIVLGRHGTTEDLKQWCARGMLEISNIPDLWKLAELDGEKRDEDDMPDIGIITRSGVHDLDIHEANLSFLKKVSFVFLVEPSRLVATAQIGLNLLIKCCRQERLITYCSVDRNCDGLVDSLSHILMANITEVSATEYPHGTSSYMCWTADSDYLQHRILPGVSRYLGMGTELSFVALKNQVPQVVWYGGETYPVLDAHWIAKQYYYDLLDYAHLPTTQETFDKTFLTSYNMCNERMSDYSYITVEDERNNLFETRRNFATIAEKQGFVNVISSEYLLREYMTENTELFTADAKAVPYITADYARTKRNAVFTLCLRLCVDGVSEDELHRELLLMGAETESPDEVVWQELCILFGQSDGELDDTGHQVIKLALKNRPTEVVFKKDATLCFARKYSVQTGKFESIYSIENKDFAQIILDDLQNAGYIAERSAEDHFIGTELKGHIYQKYLPGQFFTLNGKYYEMISVTADNRILVRRASEHINGRLSYRQVREYTIHKLEDSSSMGALKTVNGIDIYYQFADFSVKTPAYWRLSAYNDFKNGKLVEINGVPDRSYRHKQILKLDFSKLGEGFTDSVRMTLTNLLNEVFTTLFADNQPFITAVTCGEFGLPMTYSLHIDGAEDKCIYIIEDSQLDIGLLIAMERNLNRILQIISDYLLWNAEMIRKSMEPPAAPSEQGQKSSLSELAKAVEAAEGKPKKKCFFKCIIDWFKNLFRRKKKDPADGAQPTDGADPAQAPQTPETEEKPKKKGFFGFFGRRKKKDAEQEPEQQPTAEEETEQQPAQESEQPEQDAEQPTEQDAEPAAEQTPDQEPEEKKGFFGFFKRRKKKDAEPAPEQEPEEGKKKGFFGFFERRKKKDQTAEENPDSTGETLNGLDDDPAEQELATPETDWGMPDEDDVEAGGENDE